MNLELLDPFGRQVPDRVDATIQLADLLHRPAWQREQQQHQMQTHNEHQSISRKDSDIDEGSAIPKGSSSKDKGGDQHHDKDSKSSSANNTIVADDDEYRAAFHVAYNRRGTYLAVGHASGTVAIHETQTRTLASLYYNQAPSSTTASTSSGAPTPASKSTSGSNQNQNAQQQLGCSSLTWSRRSRALLAGSTGDVTVRLYDTTHPLGPEEAAAGLHFISGTNAATLDDDADEMANMPSTPATPATTKSSLTSPHSSQPKGSAGANSNAANTSSDEVLPVHPFFQTQHTPFADVDRRFVYLKESRAISTQAVTLGYKVLTGVKRKKNDPNNANANASIPTLEPPSATHPVKRYPCVAFDFPHAVAGSLQINPCRPNSGLAVLANGTLVLFWIPDDAFVKRDAVVTTVSTTESGSAATTTVAPPSHEPRCVLIPMTYDFTTSTTTTTDADGAATTTTTTTTTTSSRNFTCAAFDPRSGNKVYAVHKSGVLLGYDVAPIWKTLSEATHKSRRLPMCEPKFQWSLTSLSGTSGGGGGLPSGAASAAAAVWHLLVSRNGKFLILNSSNGSIRLYNTQDCWDRDGEAMNDDDTPDDNQVIYKKPAFVFADVVGKIKFASCDLSGDGEYVVGGANRNDNKYELYIWNTSTGALMDKLTGASTKLYSVAWHPTRSFLAVACADGLVDIWGPRINWTAFAPDFQALPMNVEYIEREDEFDIVVPSANAEAATNADKLKPNETMAVGDERGEGGGGYESDNTFLVNVTRIEPVPVFASDSENEEDVFVFETRVKNLLAGRVERASRKSGVGVDD